MITIITIIPGVGEASFAGLSPTVIDDKAPASSRNIWLGVFFSAIPVGAALGYIGSGVIMGAVRTDNPDSC